MANLDTRDKRASALFLGFGFGRLAANPDAVITGQGDRQQMDRVYRGILAGAQAAIAFANDVNTQVFLYLSVTVGLSGRDNTSMCRRQLNGLTGETTGRMKTIIVASGTVN